MILDFHYEMQSRVLPATCCLYAPIFVESNTSVSNAISEFLTN